MPLNKETKQKRQSFIWTDLIKFILSIKVYSNNSKGRYIE